MKARVALLLLAMAGSASAQTLFFTGNVTCGKAAGFAGGPAPVLVRQLGYRGEYAVDFGPAMGGFTDRGRGDLVGLDLSMRGGGGAAGVTVKTVVQGTRQNRNYRLVVTEEISGPRGTGARVCQGWARLGVQ